MKAFDSQDYKDFIFGNIPPLKGWNIELRLIKTNPACPLKEWVPVYRFGVYLLGTDTEIGHIEFRVGNTPLLVEYDGHIGYGINKEYRGNNYSLEACKLLLPVIGAQGFEKIILTCRPDNLASKKIIEKLGALFLEQKVFDLVPERADKIRLRYQLKV